MLFNEKPQAQIKAGDRNAALKLFEEARQIALALQEEEFDRTQYLKVSALSHIATAQHEVGYLTGLRKTFDEMQQIAATISDAWVRASTLHTVTAQQVKTGEIKGAEKSLVAAKEAALLSREESLYTLGQIAEIEAVMGDVDAARQTVGIMHNVASTRPSLAEKFTALRVVVKTQTAIGDLAQAKQTIAEARQVAAAVASTTDERAATQVVTGDDESPHVVPATTIYLMEIVELQARVGDIAGARQTADAIPDSRDRWDALLYKIITVQAYGGDVTGAKQTAHSITSMGYKSSALREIAKAQAEEGDTSGAKQTTDALTDPDDRYTALQAIAEAQAKAGDLSGARHTLAQAQEAASGLPEEWNNAWTKSIVLYKIGEAQCRAGDNIGAERTLLTAQRIAVDLPVADMFNATYKHIPLKIIAAALVKVGNTAAAMSVFDALTDAQPKSEALKNIAVAQAEIGDTVAAEQTVASFGTAEYDYRYKTEALTAIAAAKAKAKDTEGAKQTFAEAQRAAQRDDRFLRDNILRALAEAQTKAGETAGAVQTTKVMSEGPSKSYLMLKIVSAQREAGNLDGARETIDTIGDATNKAEALARLAAAVWNGTRPDAALSADR